MKKSYEKPAVIQSSSFAEGVYMASGGCYTASAYIHQTQETGRHDYRIQVDAHHSKDAGHTVESQTLSISFNLPVKHKGGGTLISGDGTTTLVIQYGYHNNPNDNIGLGDLIVEADEGLAIIEGSVKMTDEFC